MSGPKVRHEADCLMDNDEKDLRKEIEELEKLIAEVKRQNDAEKKRLKGGNRPEDPKVIRINIVAEYSRDPLINLIVGFLVNFILIFGIIQLLKLGEAQNTFIFLWIAALFTVYDFLLKFLLLNRFPKLVFYSSGIIFFLTHLLFFYAVDLWIFVKDFTFANDVYPLVFVFLFSVLRIIVKNLYALIVRGSSVKATEKK
jgi:hypothetical protein